MHSLLQNPFLWDAAILISAHCGLESAVKKQERCLADERWARLFEQEEWSALLSAWNSQPVFQDSQELPDRREADFSRKNLASTLRSFSLGKQEALREKIAELSMPLLWMVGEKDRAFLQLAKKVQLKDPLSKMCTIHSAGHRVPWDQPEQFFLESEAFLTQVKRRNQ